MIYKTSSVINMGKLYYKYKKKDFILACDKLKQDLFQEGHPIYI